MLAVGRPPFFRIGVALYPQFLHQTLDVFAVDLEALSLQRRCQARRCDMLDEWRNYHKKSNTS